MSSSSSSPSTTVLPLVISKLENGNGYELFESMETTDPSTGKTSFSLLRRQMHQLAAHQQQYLLPFQIPRSCTHFNTSQQVPRHLTNLVIIDSTKSGVYASSSVYFALVKPLLEEFGLNHVYVSTSSQSTIKNHARSFSSSSTVIFLSGDTSVHEFVNNLPRLSRDRCQINLAIIPTGTGNALSTSIGHTGIANALSRVLLGKPEPLSTMAVEFPAGSQVEEVATAIVTTATTTTTTTTTTNTTTTYNSSRETGTREGTEEPGARIEKLQLQSLVVTSTAFHAAIVADSDTPELRKFGSERFRLAAQENLKAPKSYYGKITLPSGDIHHTEEHSYLMFTLVKFLEKGYCISPNTQSPSSLIVHMIDMKAMEGEELGKRVMSAYNDREYYKAEGVDYVALDSENAVYARIKQKPGLDKLLYRWCVDGKNVVANITEHDDEVVIYKPSHVFRGWKVMLIV